MINVGPDGKIPLKSRRIKFATAVPQKELSTAVPHVHENGEHCSGHHGEEVSNPLLQNAQESVAGPHEHKHGDSCSGHVGTNKHVCTLHHHAHDGDGDFLNNLGWANELFASFIDTALFVAFMANCFSQPEDIAKTIPNTNTPFNYTLLSLLVGATISLFAAPGSASCHNMLERLNLLKDAITEKTQSITIDKKEILVAELRSVDADDSMSLLFKLSSLQWAQLLGDGLTHMGEFSALMITVAYMLWQDSVVAKSVCIVAILWGAFIAIIPEVIACFLALVEMSLLANKEILNAKSLENISVTYISNCLNAFSAYFKAPTTLLSAVIFFGGLLDPLVISRAVPREYLGLSLYGIMIGAICAIWPAFSSSYCGYIISAVAVMPAQAPLNDVEVGRLEGVRQPKKVESACDILYKLARDFYELSSVDKAVISGRVIARASEFAAVLSLFILRLPQLSSQLQAGLILALFCVGGVFTLSDARLLVQNITKYRKETGSSLWQDFAGVGQKSIGFGSCSYFRCADKHQYAGVGTEEGDTLRAALVA